VPTVIASSAFAITATAASKVTGIRVELVTEGTPQATATLRDAGLLIVLVPRTSPDLDAASRYVALAKGLGIPVLGLCPDGAAVYHDD
jgi:hypothetical protein